MVVPFIFNMLPSVKLDDNSFFKRHKINNIGFNWLLPAKLDVRKLAILQIAPEQALSIRAVIAELFSECLMGMSWFYGDSPHPLTPSREGRGKLHFG